MPNTLHARALQRAAEVLGGMEPLRIYLRVPLLHLQSWMEGKSTPPDAVFLRVVDLLAAEPRPSAGREHAQ